MEDKLLDADEVAAILGMTSDWIYREVRAGRLPHIRLGRYVRFRRGTLLGWLEQREAESLRSRPHKRRPGGATTPPARHRRR